MIIILDLKELITLFHSRAEFHDIIQLFKSNGYKPGETMWGYPYDWRQDFSLPCIMDPLKDRIEAAFKSCGNQKIDIISHSQGGLVFRTLVALHPEFVGAHVKRWITIGSPFQGSPVIMCGMLFGYNFGMPSILVSPQIFQKVLRVAPLSFWYFPPKNFPYSPKVGIKFEKQDQITWYGCHINDKEPCWDYDCIDTNEQRTNYLQSCQQEGIQY
ncbi:MAG: putative Lecithin:cholesterol acyltransferase 3 [Streblomastix strix]|uniref:Putative Lecithin:cholesterol acyltransferase 3 n=1 Tax=Streblomastix strix TaxID=222440 RepID=A0A5J4VSX1_9EUKA|nr:MAG: putative Lecithin:cholesterol acyltransferase 3 [Streblomastix strix]